MNTLDSGDQPDPGLRDALHALCSRLGMRASADGLWAELMERYSEPHRAYHTFAHVVECLTHLDAVRAAAGDADALEIAIWAHDAIYDPRRGDNELRSADWVLHVLVDGGVPRDRARTAHSLVLATTHASVPSEADARLICDIDLAILGAPRARFDEYESQIRAEYAWVPVALFRARRAELLGRFLARPSIYSTAYFRDALEEAARSNLQRSLAVLGESPPSD